MEEIWKPVVGFEDTHEVSSLGRVRRKEHVEKKLKVVEGKESYVDVHVKEYYYTQHVEFGGYIGVRLRKNGHEYAKLVHRLVAEAFIENDDPENKILVDHIDGRRQNNCVDNLRWVTYKENAHSVQKRYSNRPIRCVEDGNTFSSVCEAGRFYGINSTMIADAIRGNMRHSGRTFQYLEGV